MLKARRHPEFLKEIMSRHAAADAQREHIKKHVQVKNDFKSIIDSAKAVANDINAQDNMAVTERDVRSVMREELDMRFTKIKTVSLHSNSEKNLVLR